MLTGFNVNFVLFVISSDVLYNHMRIVNERGCKISL